MTDDVLCRLFLAIKRERKQTGTDVIQEYPLLCIWSVIAGLLKFTYENQDNNVQHNVNKPNDFTT